MWFFKLLVLLSVSAQVLEVWPLNTLKLSECEILVALCNNAITALLRVTLILSINYRCMGYNFMRLWFL